MAVAPVPGEPSHGGVRVNAQLVAGRARLSTDVHAREGRKRYRAITSPTAGDDDLQ